MIKQRKQIKVSLTKILKIIEFVDAFKDYDEAEDVNSILGRMIKFELTDSEIEEFAGWYLTEEANELGYDKEHYDSAKEILEKFRNNYCKKR